MSACVLCYFWWYNYIARLLSIVMFLCSLRKWTYIFDQTVLPKEIRDPDVYCQAQQMLDRQLTFPYPLFQEKQK